MTWLVLAITVNKSAPLAWRVDRTLNCQVGKWCYIARSDGHSCDFNEIEQQQRLLLGVAQQQRQERQKRQEAPAIGVGAGDGSEGGDVGNGGGGGSTNSSGEQLRVLALEVNAGPRMLESEAAMQLGLFELVLGLDDATPAEPAEPADGIASSHSRSSSDSHHWHEL